ncbi:MAG TPA: hypothetical protein P5268_00840 [Candidatus Marinimicrobia bacterium]|nr:hypothetical protein [Candidatus Neomarinimicrobiota bacterium]HRS51203.1 hypothetical protein [Candidatus Neomarinimicrobiota bacterium]HRU91559.1 hypothetical protein [Candidatus Neomarinimicrobiota bacterium]
MAIATEKTTLPMCPNIMYPKKVGNVKNKIVLSIIFLLLISCTDKSDNESYVREEAEQVIKIHYKYGFADEINTFDKTCTKDLVLDGTVTIDFWFQLDEQQAIIRELEDVDFFNLPDTLAYQSSDSITETIEPDPGIQSLRIKYNNQDKTVFWYLINSYPSEYERILRLTTLIEEILHSDPEYQSLPEPTGSYL